MTAVARPRKRHVVLAALALVWSGVTLQAATTERVVLDRHTGLALYGIDPVAYFTDRKPVEGRAEFEFRHAGAIWRFDNEGNREAFAADPEVYMPRFGGYDPVGVSRGLATPGYPALWAVHEQRLYLFYTADARRAFIADPAGVIAEASARWPTVKSELAE
jgi:hypothetical protein